mgnify:CR=1 FL=1
MGRLMKKEPFAGDENIPAWERRREQRQFVQCEARLETEGKSFTCTVIDLSLGGARLKVGAPLADQQQVRLVLDTLSLQGQVIWQSEADGIRVIGIRFAKMTEPATQKLKHVLLRGLASGHSDGSV